jgi:hypothetical protein
VRLENKRHARFREIAVVRTAHPTDSVVHVQTFEQLPVVDNRHQQRGRERQVTDGHPVHREVRR